MVSPDASQLFEQFLARVREGEEVRLEDLIEAHPEHADELRRLRNEHEEQEREIDAALPAAGEPGVSFFGRQRQEVAEPPAGVAAGQVLGDFRLLRPIGEGGMGQVWEAEQQSLRRRVALKLVRPDRVSAKTLDLFAREARAGGRLRHPGIVDVHAHGESDGVAWIAMEFVEGSWTLRDFLDEVARKEDVPPTYYRDVAAFAAKLADAMHAAHTAGVIHRDLKPQNILVTPDDAPKVTDFGLARITDESALSVTGDFAGTYLYMSPEQVAAKRIGLDHRTDVFSLGIVLYEMLALRRPFEGDTAQQVGYQIMQQDPPDLRALRSRIPRDLAVICGKCLEKDRARRYETMAELAADLRRHLANEPIVAKPPGRLRKLQLWALRNPTKSVAGAVAAVAFVAISLLLGENVRARGALQESNDELDQRNVDLQRTVGERDDAIGSLETANEDLAEQTRVAEAAAVAEKARADEVLRLSALQDYDELIARVDALWPPHPENIPAYGAWIDEAQALVDDRPLHRAKRDELREGALEPTAEEREAERRAHGDYPRLQALPDVIASGRAALFQRRDGTAAAAFAPDWSALPEDAGALNALAWPLVKPGRDVFGREAEGLALAERALELAEEAADDALVATAGRTLSRALFALGRDEEALEASAMALEVATDDQRAEYEQHLADLKGWIEAETSEAGLAEAAEELAALEAEVAELEVRVNERQMWQFPETEAGREARWWHANLSNLIESLEALQDEATGLLSESAEAVSAAHGWSVPRRLVFAERLRDGLAEGGEWADRWAAASAAIREHPDYGGLELAPQTGLVPIGPDPASGLWEFWHVATGEEPVRGEDEELALTEETGVVLVLIPEGTFWMGAQSTDPEGRNHDPQAGSSESPVHEVTLSAYFLSKYEMTQGQWSRITGRNPSYYQPPSGLAPSLLHPAEQVSWLDAMRELPRVGLSLPSEAQWENGCRAGTETPWWTGLERETLRERNAANLADQAAARAGATWGDIQDWPELDDGFAVHAPVGTYAANEWGLHEVHGNVWEWCLDGYDAGFYGRGSQVDPVAPWEGAASCVDRGGGCNGTAANARSASRSPYTPSNADRSLGVRPARVITE